MGLTGPPDGSLARLVAELAPTVVPSVPAPQRGPPSRSSASGVVTATTRTTCSSPPRPPPATRSRPLPVSMRSRLSTSRCCRAGGDRRCNRFGATIHCAPLPTLRISPSSPPASDRSRLERRQIGYRLVRLLDSPDELRATEIGIIDQGDEVQLLQRHGVYWLVPCPDGRQGSVHRMTLADPDQSAAPEFEPEPMPQYLTDDGSEPDGEYRGRAPTRRLLRGVHEGSRRLTADDPAAELAPELKPAPRPAGRDSSSRRARAEPRPVRPSRPSRLPRARGEATRPTAELSVAAIGNRPGRRPSSPSRFVPAPARARARGAEPALAAEPVALKRRAPRPSSPSRAPRPRPRSRVRRGGRVRRSCHPVRRGRRRVPSRSRVRRGCHPVRLGGHQSSIRASSSPSGRVREAATQFARQPLSSRRPPVRTRRRFAAAATRSPRPPPSPFHRPPVWPPRSGLSWLSSRSRRWSGCGRRLRGRGPG